MKHPTCTECGGPVQVRPDGTARNHRGHDALPCPGSRTVPVMHDVRPRPKADYVEAPAQRGGGRR